MDKKTIQALTRSVLAFFMFVIASNTLSNDVNSIDNLSLYKPEIVKDYHYFKEKLKSRELVNFITHIPERAFSSLDMRKIQELRCMALNNYYEAATEGIRGMQAVSQVVLNRKDSRGYPRTACGVIYQKSQFSWTFQKNLPTLKYDSVAWQQAVYVATQMYVDGHVVHGLEDALFYHADYVNPQWRGVFKIKKVGVHIFYGKKGLIS